MTKSQPRSQATRERIAAAARLVFARVGYERATIRAIADEADIHASMVMRYHGSKEALFATAVPFDLRLPNLDEIPVDQRGVTLVRHFWDRWENGGEELPALLRAAVSQEAARARMTAIFEQQLVAAISRTGDPATVPARAALIASQMLGLALTRYVLAFEPAQNLDRDFVAKHLGASIQAYLDA
ncbi:TetR family transcriptional regulator [Aureimonas sp. ME7]|uniref:TetR/AcrR family transcriptional regulator n=1 Tax=Aureimonas sp. ME7 TaxID=2744252 RepID=UPI0015F8E838|nr:TetR family transcriptional regulator [Aureimonas sp. ME7]